MMRYVFVALMLLAVLFPRQSHAQQASQALPDPLTFQNGRKVKSPKDWERRRKEILEMMTREMYGRSPERPKNMRFEVFDLDKNALNGKATRKQVTVHIREAGKEAQFDLLVYIPNQAKHPVPAIIGLNFIGNQAITPIPVLNSQQPG